MSRPMEVNVPSDGEPLDAEPPRSRRPLLVGAVVALCVLAAGAATFAFLRNDSRGGTGDTVTEVTFDEAGNATSIPEGPPNRGPIMQLDVDSGRAGSEVTLQGASFDPEYRRIELYWDRVGGPKLGTVDAPRFSVKVKIPEDAPVVNEGHFIIAVQRKDGKVVVQQSVQFYVLPAR